MFTGILFCVQNHTVLVDATLFIFKAVTLLTFFSLHHLHWPAGVPNMHSKPDQKLNAVSFVSHFGSNLSLFVYLTDVYLEMTNWFYFNPLVLSTKRMLICMQYAYSRPTQKTRGRISASWLPSFCYLGNPLCCLCQGPALNDSSVWMQKTISLHIMCFLSSPLPLIEI